MEHLQSRVQHLCEGLTNPPTIVEGPKGLPFFGRGITKIELSQVKLEDSVVVETWIGHNNEYVVALNYCPFCGQFLSNTVEKP
jgi:hypothetical protein